VLESIRVENLTKCYGAIKAIENLSFVINHGEVVGFLGPNGAGKSTTMRILCGLMPATSGRAYLGGVSIARYPEKIRKRVGFMPENNPLPNEMRVDEYLHFRAELKGLSRGARRSRVGEVMEVCSLDKRAKHKMIKTLSKGFRQRVGIADALLGNPDVIIMDEPTIGLDPHQIIGIRRLFNELKGRMTVIISSHILPEIEATCDRAIIINHGSIVALGTPKELCETFIAASSYRIVAQAPASCIRAILASISPDISIVNESIPDASGLATWIISTPKDCNHTMGHALIDALTKNPEIRLHECSQEHSHLEDVFLAATKHSWEENYAVQRRYQKKTQTLES
jgi:ABC-2 type transport system ATP-binding protein